MCLQLPNTVHLMHNRKHSQRHPALTKHIPLLAESLLSQERLVEAQETHIVPSGTSMSTAHHFNMHSESMKSETQPRISAFHGIQEILYEEGCCHFHQLFRTFQQVCGSINIFLLAVLLFVHLASFSVSDWIAEIAAFSSIIELDES